MTKALQYTYLFFPVLAYSLMESWLYMQRMESKNINWKEQFVSQTYQKWKSC